MQYSDYIFIIGEGKTITVKGEFPGVLRQRTGPSRSDIAAINRMYGLWDHYLGDDIPGAVSYDDFYSGYMAEELKISEELKRWTE